MNDGGIPDTICISVFLRKFYVYQKKEKEKRMTIIIRRF
jgi:hypothetical protein